VDPVIPILWTGANYEVGGYQGRRLFLLGESAYGVRTWTPAEQNDFIRANISGECNHHFYTKVYNTFSSVTKWVSPQSFRDFWNGIVFYNYIQETVGDRPKCRPTKEMWVRWKDPCIQTIEAQNPKRILVLGKQLWWTLIGLGMIQTNEDKTMGLVFGTNRVKCNFIPHPSSVGFQPAAWRDLTADLLR
jgi:hypothetical protein